jgi:hypothetical protein
MPFVHSLVKATLNGKTGWCAPVELGEAAPHYVNFAVPVDDKGAFFSKYICETLKTEDGHKRSDSQALVREGQDSFILRLGKHELWFTVRPGPKEERRMAYVGSLGHEDFAFPFVEIEPEDLARLDRLYDEEDTFIIGCEPFTHYSGIRTIARVEALHERRSGQ